MKNTVLFLLVFILFLTCSKSDTNLEEKSVFKAAVTFIKGQVISYKQDQEAKKNVQKGDLLGESHTIITSEDSKIELTFQDQSRILLKPNTKFNINKLLSKKNNDMSFFLEKGLILVKVKKESAKGKYDIHTPTAVASARGTKFIVKVDDGVKKNSKTTVAVESGKVALAKLQKGTKTSVPNEEQILEPNEQIQVDINQEKLVKTQIEPTFAKEFIEKESNPEDLEFTGPILTEDDLFKKYKKLELITLDNKKELKGVILETDENNMIIHTVKGMIKINLSHIIAQKTIKY